MHNTCTHAHLVQYRFPFAQPPATRDYCPTHFSLLNYCPTHPSLLNYCPTQPSTPRLLPHPPPLTLQLLPHPPSLLNYCLTHPSLLHCSQRLSTTDCTYCFITGGRDTPTVSSDDVKSNTLSFPGQLSSCGHPTAQTTKQYVFIASV